MKKLVYLTVSLLGLFLAAVSFAQNYDYDTAVKGTKAATAVAGGLIFVWVVIAIVFGVIGLFFLIWWILMLVDCSKRDFKDKSTWLIILIVSFFIGLHWLSTLIYYFMVKRKNLGTLKGKEGQGPTTQAPSTPSTPPTPQK